MRRLLALIGRLHDWLTDLGIQVAKVCIATIFALYCWEVFGRYFLGMGTWLANEYVPYAVCAATFLMMPAVTRGKGHVAIGVLENLIPARFALHARALILVISLVVCGVIAWIALMENFRQVAQGVDILRVRQTPKIYVSMWITYGFTSSAIYFLRMLTAIRESSAASRAELETL